MTETALEKSDTTTPAPQPATPAEMIRDERFQEQLALALPKTGISGERFARIVFTELRTNPRLAECEPTSFARAVMTCAQLGLEPGPLGKAYLIPRWNNRSKCLEATYQNGYKGLLDLAWRSGKVQSLQVESVHENDFFDYCYGINARLDHKPADSDRGPWLRVYAALQTKGGGWVFKVMNRDEVLAIRDRFSESWKKKGQASTWGTDELSMALKTVLLRVLKFAPLSTDVERAISEEERGDVLDLNATVPVQPAAAALESLRDVTPDEEPYTPGFAGDIAVEPGDPAPTKCAECGQMADDYTGPEDGVFTHSCPNGHAWPVEAEPVQSELLS